LSFSKKIQFTKNYFLRESDYKKRGRIDTTAFFDLKALQIYERLLFSAFPAHFFFTEDLYSCPHGLTVVFPWLNALRIALVDDLFVLQIAARFAFLKAALVDLLIGGLLV
jgi:hypothetical protein